MKKFTLHSGGASGSDHYWSQIAAQYGIKAKHYFYGKQSQNNSPFGNTQISELDAEEGRAKAALVAKANWGYQHRTMKDPRLIRNWSQVKYSDAIFAIGTIIQPGMLISSNRQETRVALKAQVSGGTGYAVEMAIQENKPVYVFDQNRQSWYFFTEFGYKKMRHIPTLTENFAGIGTRNINSLGMQAIRDILEKNFSDLKQRILAMNSGLK